MEVVAGTNVEGGDDGEITVPARKLYDICRALPAGAEVRVSEQDGRAVVQSGKSRFVLGILPAADFPNIDTGQWDVTFTLAAEVLRGVVERTHFCMAHQDVRYYLNGLLLELSGDQLRAVATDGHRMGLSEAAVKAGATGGRQVIVPRKGVHEMSRFLSTTDAPVEVMLSSNHLRATMDGVTLTSKLIDGRFPDYDQVMPSTYRWSVRIQRQLLREALGRVAILANEKYRGARFAFQPGLLTVTAHNPEQEEAQEQLAVEYQGEELEIGFNVNYVIEAISGLGGDEVELAMNDPNSSSVLQSPTQSHTRYIIMPMRL